MGSTHHLSRLVAVAAVTLAAVACSDDSDSTTDSTSATSVPSPDTTTATPAISATTPAATPPATSANTTATTPAETAPTTAATTPVTTESTVDDTVPSASANMYPSQPAGVPFPGSKWPTGELPNGVDRTVLDFATDVAFGAPDADTRVASIVVVKGGKVVYERYHPRDDAREVFPSWSMAKSFTSALIGLLVDDGRLTLDEHPPRTEWRKKNDPRREITLRNLLQMSSGLRWDEGPDYIAWAGSPDAAHFVAERELDHEPGTVWEYSTGTTSLLVGIAADELGGCEETEDYLRERLLDPIGITSAEIFRDARGCWFGGFGMNMTTRDFARFGLLYLRGGNWDGEQILTTSWIDETRVPASTSAVYGLQWWLNEHDHTFEANGAFGQRIVVQPELDLVIAVNNFGGDDCTLIGTVLTEFSGEPAGGCIGRTGTPNDT